MEILILDKLLRPIDIVDRFVSLIWAERYSELGDFELVILSTFANKNRFVMGTMLSVTESKRVMKVETVEESIDEDKGHVLKIKGRDIASILQQRTALYRSIFTFDIKPIWYMSGWSPGNTMRYMFWKICVEGGLAANDIIPFIQWGAGGIDDWETLYPSDTIEEPEQVIIWGQKMDSLYNAIKELGDLYDLGFRLYKDPDSPKLYFNVYPGSDRTSLQTDVAPVIFSTDMQNLQNVTEYLDSTKEYNLIHVVYPYKDSNDNDTTFDVKVYDPDFQMNPDQGGFERKAKVLVITTLPEEVTNTHDYMVQRGRDELSKSRPIGVLEGEVNQYSNYVYERDYFLGDIVEVRSETGTTAYMRVEEQIMVQDDSGQRSYPGLVIRQFINAGTWASWKYDVEWTAMGSEEYWGNQ